MKMKHSFILIFALLVAIAGCKKVESFDLNRPSVPTGLTVSKGDTSVFIKWNAVEGALGYVVVRGLKAIAEDLKVPEFVDAYAPDTTVEYRIYALNKDGWRSYRYASDSGYVAIPKGILPRPPVVTATDASNYKNCTVSWTGGRFAKSFNVYRNGILIGDKIVGNTYIDTKAPTNQAEYRVFSVNDNGTSVNDSKDMGSKGFFYNETFEDLADGFIFVPWTFRAPTVGYYTEGNPTVTNSEGFGGSAKSLKIVSGKIQQLCDWGGVPEKGKYKVSVEVKKSQGGFWMVPNFSGVEHVGATGVWTKYEIETAEINKGATFNFKIEPYGDGPTLIDNWSIEYTAPN